MPILTDYRHFDGKDRETGPIHNALAYQGVVAPHTGKPLSEALMMGVSGGAAFGYFTFEYQGYDPHIALLTRNTFDPMETLFDRLALPREVLQTTKPELAMENLVRVIESGSVPLVWVDGFSLPYTLLPYDKAMWGMTPVVVYGVEGDTVTLADRAAKPLTITVDELMKARARVKEDKYRIVVLETPDMTRLPSAVQRGIWQAISLYTDAPPRGKRDNFGLAAYQHWAAMLINTRNKHSWERYFPAGRRLYAALAGNIAQPGAFDWICTWSATDGAERGMYADFLDEAATILNKPTLAPVAARFRAAAEAWCALANAMLPDGIPLLRETRDLKLRQRDRLRQDGAAALDELRAINARLDEIRAEAAENFPMTPAEVVSFRENLRDHVLKIHDIERDAITALQDVMA